MYSKKTQMQRKKMLMGKMGRSHDITLTPRDFNYDNHHYQYLKYTKRGKVSYICHFRCISAVNDGENITQCPYLQLAIEFSDGSVLLHLPLYIFLNIRNSV